MQLTPFSIRPLLGKTGSFVALDEDRQDYATRTKIQLQLGYIIQEKSVENVSRFKLGAENIILERNLNSHCLQVLSKPLKIQLKL